MMTNIIKTLTESLKTATTGSNKKKGRGGRLIRNNDRSSSSATTTSVQEQALLSSPTSTRSDSSGSGGAQLQSDKQQHLAELLTTTSQEQQTSPAERSVQSDASTVLLLSSATTPGKEEDSGHDEELSSSSSLLVTNSVVVQNTSSSEAQLQQQQLITTTNVIGVPPASTKMVAMVSRALKLTNQLFLIHQSIGDQSSGFLDELYQRCAINQAPIDLAYIYDNYATLFAHALYSHLKVDTQPFIILRCDDSSCGNQQTRQLTFTEAVIYFLSITPPKQIIEMIVEEYNSIGVVMAAQLRKSLHSFSLFDLADRALNPRDASVDSSSVDEQTKQLRSKIKKMWHNQAVCVIRRQCREISLKLFYDLVNCKIKVAENSSLLTSDQSQLIEELVDTFNEVDDETGQFVMESVLKLGVEHGLKHHLPSQTKIAGADLTDQVMAQYRKGNYGEIAKYVSIALCDGADPVLMRQLKASLELPDRKRKLPAPNQVSSSVYSRGGDDGEHRRKKKKRQQVQQEATLKKDHKSDDVSLQQEEVDQVVQQDVGVSTISSKIDDITFNDEGQLLGCEDKEGSALSPSNKHLKIATSSNNNEEVVEERQQATHASCENDDAALDKKTEEAEYGEGAAYFKSSSDDPSSSTSTTATTTLQPQAAGGSSPPNVITPLKTISSSSNIEISRLAEISAAAIVEEEEKQTGGRNKRKANRRNSRRVNPPPPPLISVDTYKNFLHSSSHISQLLSELAKLDQAREVIQEYYYEFLEEQDEEMMNAIPSSVT